MRLPRLGLAPFDEDRHVWIVREMLAQRLEQLVGAGGRNQAVDEPSGGHALHHRPWGGGPHPDGRMGDLLRVHGMKDPALQAGLVAAVVSGAPSTLIALARGDDVLAGGRAAGTLLLPREQRTLPLLAAAVPVHLALSLGWAVVLDRTLPRGRELAGGVAGGLAIAALDLVVIGRRLPAIRALPQGRQWADHVAFGLAVGATLARCRRVDSRA
jgi:hypothetical protein